MERRPFRYIYESAPGHPRADKGGRVYQHILVAEKVLGKYLPEGAEVHHVDGNGKDNRNDNLVIAKEG